jgi:hypothetical protein
MFRMFMVGMVMLGMVGCAAKASGPSVQEQLDQHIIAMAKAQEAQGTKDANQDAAIAEIYAKLDGMFRKGR